MIDLKLFETLLIPMKMAVIEPDDVLDWSTMVFLSDKRWQPGLVTKLFQNVNRLPDGKLPIWSYDAPCGKCGAILRWRRSKTSLLDALSGIRDHEKKDKLPVCDRCAEASERQNEQETFKRAERNNAERQARSREFIKNYLGPNDMWATEPKKWFKYLSEAAYLCDAEIVAAHIASLPYKDFLKTPYWKAVANHIKFKANFRCSLCSERSGLDVHHRTYAHHGYEHAHLQDLICLCRGCHGKFHDKVINS